MYTSNCEGWALIPEHCRDGLKAYIEHGQPVGHFLTAVLSNQLVQAFNRADRTNSQAMLNYAMFLHTCAPADCWGSPDEVKAWIKGGGLKGRLLEPTDMPEDRL